jgi:predicted phosphate transport protein (TIGR00153 family)
MRPKDRAFFQLFNEAGENALKAARLLDDLIAKLPQGQEVLTREILAAEHEGDRITHDIIRRLNTMFVTPLDREDIYALATRLDDVVDYVEEAADLLGLYGIEAPMEQAREMSKVLVGACEQLAKALAELRELHGLEPYWIEIHQLENDADRISRDAVAALFSNGTDPMAVIRWKDIFSVLEQAVDATESAAHTIEGIVIKNG